MHTRPSAVGHVDGIGYMLERQRVLEQIFGIARDRRLYLCGQNEAPRLQRCLEVGGRCTRERPHADAETRRLTANNTYARRVKIVAAATLPTIRHSVTAKANMARSKTTGTQDSADRRRRSSKYQSPGSVRARTPMIQRSTVINAPLVVRNRPGARRIPEAPHPRKLDPPRRFPADRGR